MKTIKFRGVRKDGKGFCYGDLIQTPDSDQRIIWFDEKATFNEMIVFDSHALFTGFLDKSGKEIYEGDIIGDWTETDQGYIQSNYPVYFDDKKGMFRIDISFNQDRLSSEPLYKELRDFDYEIVGNIYEKTEKLKS